METKQKIIISGMIFLSIFLLYWSGTALTKRNNTNTKPGTDTISYIPKHSEDIYSKAVEAETEDPCTPPEGYTDDAWRQHMGHHPDEYKDCLSQTTDAQTAKEISEEGQGHEEESHEVPPEFQDMINPISVTETSIERGQQLYSLSCADCHGFEGRGDGHMAMMLDPQPSDLQDAHVQGKSDGALFYIITEGVGETEMPGYKGLSEEDRWNLVNYLRTLK